MQALKICTKITVPKFHSTSVTCDYDGGTSCHSLLLVATRHPNRLPSFAVVNEPGLVAVEEACVVACYCDCTFEVADGVVVAAPVNFLVLQNYADFLLEFCVGTLGIGAGSSRLEENPEVEDAVEEGAVHVQPHP